MQPRMSTEIRITSTSTGAYRIDCAGEVLQLLSFFGFNNITGTIILNVITY
jgi:hypothetical protein